MSFSYNTGDDAVTRDYVRFMVGDTVSGSGRLPESVNFTDEELDMMISVEGTWQRAVAACYEALQAAWATHVDWQGDGLTVKASDIAEQWGELAAKQRKKFPGGTSGATMGNARTIIKVDGYSQDIASSQVDDVTY